MYKVIGSLRTRAFRVVWMLEELGQGYEVEPVRPRSETARAYNPSGKVPILLIDGEPILDSVAIVQFLADRHRRFTAPAGIIERACQDGWTQFSVDDLESPLWFNAKNTFVRLCPLPAFLRRNRAVAARAPAQNSLVEYGISASGRRTNALRASLLLPAPCPVARVTI